MNTKISVIGDSFVAGTGDPACLGWVGRVGSSVVGRGRDITIYNLGIRRDTSTDVASRWRAEAERRLAPDRTALFVFSFGVNDCIVEGGVQRVGEGDTLRNTSRILSEASGIAATLFVGPPPIADTATNERIAALSAALAQCCDDADVPYLAVFDALRISQVWMEEAGAGDGAHPGANGYAALASLVDNWDAWRRYFP